MTNEILSAQYRAAYDENNWFVALKGALDGVTAEQAAWKPANVDNSIWESVNHLCYWNERYLQIWKKEMTDPPDVENKNTFKSDESDWQATIKKLYRVMDEWRGVLGSVDEQKLKRTHHRKIQIPLVFGSCSPKYA